MFQNVNKESTCLVRILEFRHMHGHAHESREIVLYECCGAEMPVQALHVAVCGLGSK
jgi:hypothetical protein